MLFFKTFVDVDAGVCAWRVCVYTVLYTNTHARWFAVFWIKAILMWRQSNRRVKDGEQTNKQASKHANREYFLCSLCAANKDINGTEMEKTLNEIKRKVAIEIAGKLANCKSKNNKKQKQQQNANNSQQWWKKIANVNQTISERMKWGSVCLRLRFVCLRVAKSWSWQKFSLQFHAFTLSRSLSHPSPLYNFYYCFFGVRPFSARLFPFSLRAPALSRICKPFSFFILFHFHNLLHDMFFCRILLFSSSFPFNFYCGVSIKVGWCINVVESKSERERVSEIL